ncbi:2'-5' RNA ligase [Hymenobacter gelipurpurascens]|uniref:2'-5' RNA ligase n=1 Tax=Hymenobacter gelipurpurascens TaxID=89968 RepID=A0A212T3Q1_9BACT|nr:2'-5' RNA ligase family protein [Hymenobacter gelipurpurascens]SNC60461.1 2'-5' RNA ligase [Hymenobacter gelipurpurascens]
MILQEHYNHMREQALQELAHGHADLDTLIDSEHDLRRGISLLARPTPALAAKIAIILADFQRLEPDQYYYPTSDIHLTILSIISCYSGFTLGTVAPAEYRSLVGDILHDIPPFSITFSGLTASPGGIMLQGFPQDSTLQHLRDQLRKRFRKSGLQQSIDTRYSIHTAHSTVVRFRAPLANPARLVEAISNYRHHAIGSFEVDTIELVYHDWYQRAATTVLLAKYALGSS